MSENIEATTATASLPADTEAPFNSFAKRLRVLRVVRDMTQGDVAKAAGVSQVMVHRWEQGSTLSASNLMALAKALDVSPEFLVGEDGDDYDDLRDCVECAVAHGLIEKRRAKELLLSLWITCGTAK